MNMDQVLKKTGYCRLGVGIVTVGVAALLGIMWTCPAQAVTIQWRLGPDYPMGIQDSAVGYVGGKIVSAGGFTRYVPDVEGVLNKYGNIFGVDEYGHPLPSGFTNLALAFDPGNESAGWSRIPNLPGPARQGGAVAVVNGAMYVMGGLNYTAPNTYSDTYRLQYIGGSFVWQTLPTARIPWPAYGAAASTAVIGSNIYLCGTADWFQGPGASGTDFHSEADRNGHPVGNAMFMLDTNHIEAGWKRKADCPGVPKFDSALAAAGGKIYQLGGIYAPVATTDDPNDPNDPYPYFNAVDSWMYDPTSDRWTQLANMPDGTNRRALVYDDRYIVLPGGYTYPKTWHLDGAVTDAPNVNGFEKTVMAYDTRTGMLGAADSMIEETSLPSATIVGDMLYTLGGEGGPRLFHPATLQIGHVSAPEPSSLMLLLCAGLGLLAFRRQLSDGIRSR